MKYLKIGSSNKYLVFLHGWGADKRSFLWLSNYFNNYSLLFVDFAGFGESDEPTKSYCLDDYVDDLHNVLQLFDIESLVLIGHSFGGRVAVKFCYYHQNEYKIIKLCLIDSAGIKPKRNIYYYAKILRYKFIKNFYKNGENKQALLSNFGSDDYKVLSQIMKQTFINVVNENLEKYAKCLKIQSIIIWGENDQETKLFMAKKYNKLIAGSKLYILKGAGHFSFLDCQTEFLILLDSFVKN